MLRFAFRALIVLVVLYWTPMGALVRPLLTSKSEWFPGIPLSGTGTGFYVNEENVVTNHHVVDACKRIVVGGRDNRIADATVIAYDAKNDLAVLKTVTRVAVPLFLSDGEVKIGDETAAPDYTSGQGEFSIYREGVKKLDADNVYTALGARPGNSGSPLMDEDGRVIGVIKGWQGEGWLGFFMLTGYTRATNLPHLTSFLAKNNITYTIYRGNQPHLLKESNYKDFIAVNIGCSSSGPWFAH
jgi:hypothetical protein